MTETRHRLTVQVELELRQESEDSYTVTCPQLGCIFVHEASEEAALRHAREALVAYLETCLEHDDDIIPEEIIASHEVIEDHPIEEDRSPGRISSVFGLTTSYDYALPAA